MILKNGKLAISKKSLCIGLAMPRVSRLELPPSISARRLWASALPVSARNAASLRSNSPNVSRPFKRSFATTKRPPPGFCRDGPPLRAAPGDFRRRVALAEGVQDSQQPNRKVLRRQEQIESLPGTQQPVLLKTIDTFLENDAPSPLRVTTSGRTRKAAFPSSR
jgi:hypothetical protein